MDKQEELANRFKFHPATTDKSKITHGIIRNLCLDTAKYLDELLPEGREKSTAMTKLEEVMFWGNAAIARNPVERALKEGQ